MSPLTHGFCFYNNGLEYRFILFIFTALKWNCKKNNAYGLNYFTINFDTTSRVFISHNTLPKRKLPVNFWLVDYDIFSSLDERNKFYIYIAALSYT